MRGRALQVLGFCRRRDQGVRLRRAHLLRSYHGEPRPTRALTHEARAAKRTVACLLVRATGDMTLISADFDFAAVRNAMQRYVDRELLAGVSYAVLLGRDLVEMHCVGLADREQKSPLRVDHLFRVFSNTKLITSCAALLLLEQGHFGLDDPIERYIPQLAARRVLRPRATTLTDTEPANGPITIRHLMSHSSGLSYGLLDPGTLIYRAYNESKVLNPEASLADMVEVLADLPLLFHPGTAWEYSVATDVLARLVELVSNQRFDTFIRSRILDPLGMTDTAFVVPEAKRHRLTAYYAGA